jgi:hypothetical protein
VAAVSVSIGTVTRRDLPIHLTGLGTVQASYTVNIRPQVDGRLETVMFVEGQVVKKETSSHLSTRGLTRPRSMERLPRKLWNKRT